MQDSISALMGLLKISSVAIGAGGAFLISPWLGALAMVTIILCKALDKAPEIIRAWKGLP